MDLLSKIMFMSYTFWVLVAACAVIFGALLYAEVRDWLRQRRADKGGGADEGDCL